MATTFRRTIPTSNGGIAAPVAVSSWGVPQVRHAIASHERGLFTTSGALCDAFGRDDRITTSLETRVLGVLGLPFRVDPSDTTDQRNAKRYARDVDAWWFDAFPESMTKEGLTHSHTAGFAIGEISYVDDGIAKLQPHIDWHHPSNARRTRDDGLFEIRRPDSSWEVVTPGDGKWLVLAPGGARTHMQGMVLSLGLPYLVRQFARRDWARRSEFEGLGIRKGRVPKTATPSSIRKFVDELGSLGSETAITLPEGFDVELLAGDGSADVGFEKLLAHTDASITIRVLGQNLTTQIEGGSFAAAGVHARVQLDRIKADVAMLETTFRSQVLKPWLFYAYGETDLTLAPWPKFDATPPDDLRVYAVALQSLGQTIPVLLAAGVEIEPLLKRFELKRVPPSPPPPAPPQADTPQETPSP